MNKIIVLAVVLLVLGGGYSAYRFQKYQKEDVPAAIEFTELAQSARQATIKERSEFPAELNLKLPFYSQAPFANWDYPWQEACEEASILLIANGYFGHEWTAVEFNEEILDMVEWQKRRFGDYWHTTMRQTAEILEGHLKLKSVIHEDPSLDDIKLILNKGHFIVMPLAGKLLKNPYFKNGGPEYHVVVVKGYTKDNGIITHDVGTRRGEDYVYSWEIIDNAWHDYAVPIESGERMVLEVLPTNPKFK